ncbi:hypothetical protein AC739_15585 [Planococcus glaciei]|uniref:hypothetical protein n=1 Tax=Planococcus glaciei TaxID=459472 RepID=UPI00069D4BFD|nr:hypothetical protein [Planococcus glaciei]KOF09264.1 hypothetical protein AC739_15585 [Planococcus glaciei]
MKIKKFQNKIEAYKYGLFWEFIKKDVIMNPFVGIATAIFLLLLGAVIAAIINYISADPETLASFIMSFAICLLLLGIGFVFFFPYWNFRKRYYFLDEQENELAKKIVKIHNRSKQALTSSLHGINAVQLFKLETHTGDNHVKFIFKETFTLKSKHFNLSKFKEKELEVPTAFFSWLHEPHHPVPDYGPLINVHLYEWMQIRAEKEPAFLNIIDNWEVEFAANIPKVTGLHYQVLFDSHKPVDVKDFIRGASIDSIFSMNYNGVNEEHINRQYNSLRLILKDENEGAFEYILLIVNNNERIQTAQVVKVMKEILK